MTDISKLLPHRGTARMLERVESWSDAEIVALTNTHRAADNPLRCAGRLSAVHLAEYAAQAMALHGALKDRAAGRSPRAALLVAVRDLTLHRDFLDELSGELRVVAVPQVLTASSWQYSFVVTHAGETIASGRVAAIASDVTGS